MPLLVVDDQLFPGLESLCVLLQRKLPAVVGGGLEETIFFTSHWVIKARIFSVCVCCFEPGL